MDWDGETSNRLAIAAAVSGGRRGRPTVRERGLLRSITEI